jgi:hypothetical protein
MNEQTQLVRVIVYRQANGFWVEVPSMPGCHGRGQTMQAALQAARTEILETQSRPTYVDGYALN